MSHTMEVLRRVFDDKSGYNLEIGPDSDALGCVELRAIGDANIEYWGPVRLVMQPEYAALIGQALIDASKEAKK